MDTDSTEESSTGPSGGKRLSESGKGGNQGKEKGGAGPTWNEEAREGKEWGAAETAPASRIDLSGLHRSMERVKEELKKVVVGQDELVEQLLVAILADGHVLIEGVPGVAKTLAAKAISKTISVNFSRVQFTPDLMPADVLGTSVFDQKKGDFEFKKGPVFANIVLVDEVNRAPAKTQAALFEIMEERQVTADGQEMPLDPPFITLATQNPVEQEGTYRLPEAQLDRFLFKITVDYPSLEEEKSILSGIHAKGEKGNLEAIQPVLTREELLENRKKVGEVHVEKNLVDYIARIVHSTRDHPDLFLGASPRASLSLLVSAKALAAIRGRDFVTPEDIRYVVSPVLAHRILLTPEKEMEGVAPPKVVAEVVDRIEVPR